MVTAPLLRRSLYVNGEWRPTDGANFDVRDPSTGDLVDRFESAGAAGVATAVAAATNAAEAWQACAAGTRADFLFRAADRLAACEERVTAAIVRCVGKPVREAREEARRSVAIVRYQAGAALDPEGEVVPPAAGGGLVLARRRALGAIGLITPWNFPVAIPVWKIAPALAYGNTVVLKPAPAATQLAMEIVDAFRDLPPGVLNVVGGGVNVGQAVASSPLAAISFTGSTRSGRAVALATAETGARLQAELGGKNASIVLAGADLEHAAQTIARAAMGFAGQKCTATSRVIVERPVARVFAEILTGELARLKVGPARDEATDVGPMIEPAAVERVAGFVERARAQGATILHGGERLPGLGPTFHTPTLMGNVGLESELATTEVFGPVLAFFEARDASEAARMANASRYGLAAAVFTNRLDHAVELTAGLHAGLVRVNGATPGVPFNAPFAPALDSGIGAPEQGKAAREFFTRAQTVTIVAV